jgi:O-antigen/teichoic acid export membrane protein
MQTKSLKYKLLHGGAWAFSGKAVTSLTSLAINALLARLLSLEEMGAYFLTFSLISIATVVAQIGLSQTIVRLVAESMGTNRAARARLAVRWILYLVGFGTLVMACMLAFGGGTWVAGHLFKSTIMSQVVVLAAVWMALNSLQSVIAEIYRGFHDIRLATILGGLVTGLLAMLIFLGLWLVHGRSNLHQVVIMMIVAGCSSVLLSRFVMEKTKCFTFAER